MPYSDKDTRLKYHHNYYLKNKETMNIQGKKWQKQNPDVVWKACIKYKYGIKKEEYEFLLEKQNNVCAICKKENVRGGKITHLDVDHNHQTKKIRGLLCNNCNRALGHFQESKENLKAALLYLEKYDG